MKTKSTILITLFIFATIHLFAQKPASSLIIGSWQTSGPIGDSSHGTYCTIISFYKNHVYQIKGTHVYPRDTGKLRFDTLSYEAGKWKFKRHGKCLKYSKPHPIPVPGAFSMFINSETEKVFICMLNDTCLYTDYLSCDDTLHVIHYKRIPHMPETKDNYKTWFDHVDSTFVLVNSLDTSKKKIIKESYDINLNNTNVSRDSLVTITHEFTGNIKQVSDTGITLKLSEETIDTSMKNGFYSTLYKSFSGDAVNDSLELRTIKIQNIELMKYRGAGRNMFNGIGSILVGTTLTTMFIVAPLASINFKKWEINSPKYFDFFKAGIIQLAVGIPLTIFGKEKKIKLTSKNAIKQKDYWYFK